MKSRKLFDDHSQFMEKAFTLAKKGFPFVFPNPAVGSIVVSKGAVVGKGYHKKYGDAHAEVNALREAGNKAKGADLYISLEPCTTFGKTPPCTEAIIEAGIKRVFIGQLDPNSCNRNRSKEILRKHGIPVTLLPFGKESILLNKVFFVNQLDNIPFITLKAGASLDGQLMDSKMRSKWITSEESRIEVHKLRSQCQAIAIGRNTFNKDNPHLDLRLIKSKKKMKEPMKVLFSKSGNLDPRHFLLNKETNSKVIIVTTQKGKSILSRKVENRSIQYLLFEGMMTKRKMISIMKQLKNEGVCQLLVEGGANLLHQFLAWDLFHEVHLFMAPLIFGGNGNVWSGEGPLFSLGSKNQWMLHSFYKRREDIHLNYWNKKRHPYFNAPKEYQFTNEI